MKVFVSGQITDIENVHKAQKALQDAGHEITHDWTQNEAGANMLSSPEAKLENIEETARRAQLDIQGVVDSEAYVICTDNSTAGKGMYAELGAALALNITTGKPRVYVVGQMNHMSVFYFHPAVRHCDSTQSVIDDLLS